MYFNFAVHFAFLVASTNAFAETTRAPSNITVTQNQLPVCIDDEAKIIDIQRVMKANSKNSHKYDGYRKVLAGISDEELIARLTYAETMATHCEEMNSKISPAIAATIKNRIRIRNNNVLSVIFERDQFASSLNNYDESMFREFLCPRNSELWEISTRAAQNSLEGFPRDGFHYYLYKHSSRFKPPGWAEGPQAYARADFGSGKLDECIKFFKNPKWK